MVEQGVGGRVALLVDGAAVQLQRVGHDGDAVVVLVVRGHWVGEHQRRGGAVARRVVGVARVGADGQRQPRRAARGVDRDRLAERRRDLDDVAGRVVPIGRWVRRYLQTNQRGAVEKAPAQPDSDRQVARSRSPGSGQRPCLAPDTSRIGYGPTAQTRLFTAAIQTESKPAGRVPEGKNDEIGSTRLQYQGAWTWIREGLHACARHVARVGEGHELFARRTRYGRPQADTKVR